MTYITILEKLALSPDIETEWKKLVAKDKRKEAGRAMAKFIETNFHILWSWKTRKNYFDPYKYSRKITYKRAHDLYDFFFYPKQVKLTYSWE